MGSVGGACIIDKPLYLVGSHVKDAGMWNCTKVWFAEQWYVYNV